MSSNKMFQNREDAQNALKEYFLLEHTRQVYEAYETYLDESYDEIHGYGYGEVWKVVDPIAFDLASREFCWELGFEEFCEFVGLDIEVMNELINRLMRQTNKWYDFKIVPTFNEDGYRIWENNSLVYELVMLTSRDVKREIEGKKKRVKRQIERLDYLIGLKVNYPIVGMLRRERRRLVDSL